MTRTIVVAGIGVLAALAGSGCGSFSPTAPFEGFDGQGSRISGSFDGGVSAQSTGAVTAASAEGIRVSIQERPSLATTVDGSGKFELVGVPAGSWVLTFHRDGALIGSVAIRDVRSNQEIRIVVALTESDEVVLLDQDRDEVSFEGECPRGPGFWCQNQGGQNPNLSADEFESFAAEAATLLAEVPALDSPEEVAAAVCDVGDQLLRQLATLALNLAAETLTRDTALEGEDYASVGEAFDAAVQAALGTLGRDERNEIKDVLDRINNNENHDTCENATPDEDDEGDDPDDGVPTSGQITICHIPPGNPSAKHTLVIGAAAWPAHRAHGDTLGPCGG